MQQEEDVPTGKTLGSSPYALPTVRLTDTDRNASYAPLKQHENSLLSTASFGGDMTTQESSFGGTYRSDEPAEYHERKSHNRQSLAMAQHISMEDLSKKLAGAKLIGGLQLLTKGAVGIEKESVYGAALLMPQLARSLNWPIPLTALVIRSWLFYSLCLLLHGALLTFLAKEERVMDRFSGQMNLCDFGAFTGPWALSECDELGTGCMGPGGTTITNPRLYSWTQWTTRKFVADSLKAVFPDKASLIDEKADPGEYGVESYWCRLLCCFIFMASLSSEVENMMKMANLLWSVPSEQGCWIDLLSHDAEDTIDHWLDHVSIKADGIPLGWKIFNWLFLFVPKFVLFAMTAQNGINFLMETGNIDDFIVNAVALTFLLNLDNMVFEAFSSQAAQKLCDMCDDFILWNVEDIESNDERWILDTFHEKNRFDFSCGRLRNLLYTTLPLKMGMVMSLTFGFISYYYYTHCEFRDGRWVSIDMYLPKSAAYNFWNSWAEFIFPIPSESKPYWTYPR